MERIRSGRIRSGFWWNDQPRGVAEEVDEIGVRDPLTASLTSPDALLY